MALLTPSAHTEGKHKRQNRPTTKRRPVSLATGPGLEPGITGPKPVVLPITPSGIGRNSKRPQRAEQRTPKFSSAT